MFSDRVRQWGLRGFMGCIVAGTMLATGCDSGGDDDNSEVLLQTSLQSPPVSATAFTSAGTFITQNSGAITVTVTSSDADSNILLNVAMPQGVARNQAQFDAGTANSAVVTINNPQTGQGHGVQILDANAEVGTTYMIEVVQAVE